MELLSRSLLCSQRTYVLTWRIHLIRGTVQKRLQTQNCPIPVASEFYFRMPAACRLSHSDAKHCGSAVTSLFLEAGNGSDWKTRGEKHLPLFCQKETDLQLSCGLDPSQRHTMSYTLWPTLILHHFSSVRQLLNVLRQEPEQQEHFQISHVTVGLIA